MKIKLEKIDYEKRYNIQTFRQFRDENKNSWTVDFEVYKEESTRIN